jgi:hypothetical protein
MGLAAALYVASAGSAAWGDTLAGWTFETSIPATAGPHAAETGSGSATGLHASGSVVYSNPAGNGSVESFSSNMWAVGDYYQFQLSSTGYQDLSIDWDQVASGTGPAHFDLQYSTDGSSFNSIAPYTVLNNTNPPGFWNTTTFIADYHFSVDLSAISAVENAATLFLRMTMVDTVSAGGGTVGTSGTNRVDNVIVNASPVPEPSSLALASLAGLATVTFGVRRLRRAK